MVSLKPEKSPSVDKLIKKFLKYSPIYVVKLVTKLSNIVLASREAQMDWTIDLI